MNEQIEALQAECSAASKFMNDTRQYKAYPDYRKSEARYAIAHCRLAKATGINILRKKYRGV